MKFIDEATIYIKAGNGGNGVVSFLRQRSNPRGGPDGGTGGKGGDVVFEASSSKNTLLDFQFQQEYKAGNGGNGGKNNMTGADGENLVVPLPPGSIIKNRDTEELIGDLDKSGSRVIVARGGRGGRGNSCFANSTRQAPQFAEEGEKVEGFWVKVELKLLADVGLVGMPNAGKSTIISKISSARPKIADYPFTTLVPNLGVVKYAGMDFVVADVPGLIEGAHMGAGLGIKFLKHIERTRVLVHVIDMSPLVEDPIQNIEIINNELSKFELSLLERPMLYVINKMDVAEKEKVDAVKKYLSDRGHHYIEMSGFTGLGTDVLIKNLVNMLGKIDERETSSIRGDI